MSFEHFDCKLMGKLIRNGRSRDQQVAAGLKGVHPSTRTQRSSSAVSRVETDSSTQRLVCWRQVQDVHGIFVALRFIRCGGSSLANNDLSGIFRLLWSARACLLAKIRSIRCVMRTASKSWLSSRTPSRSKKTKPTRMPSLRPVYTSSRLV